MALRKRLTRAEYESKAGYKAVQVSREAKELVAQVNRETHIPKRHVVDMALRDYLPKHYALKLAPHSSQTDAQAGPHGDAVERGQA